MSKVSKPMLTEPAVKESRLHSQIVEYCEQQNWPVFRGSMAHRTYRTLGEPDLTILMPGGRALLVECKSKTGKLSMDQRALAILAKKNEHTIYVVRSLEEFVAISSAVLLISPQQIIKRLEKLLAEIRDGNPDTAAFLCEELLDEVKARAITPETK